MSKYVLGVDFGTTGIRSVIFDLLGNEIGQYYSGTTTQYPRPGWVALEAEHVVTKSFEATRGAIAAAGIDPAEIGGIGITHICATFVPVDKDGNYLYSILPWNDLRGAEMFPYIRECWARAGIDEAQDYETTGYPLGTVSTLSKVLWLRKNHPEIWEKTEKIVGMQAMLIHAYTGEAFYDDEAGIGYSKLANASTFQYDPKVAAMYDLDLDLYAERKPSGTLAGQVPSNVAERTGLKIGTPVYVGAGDQRCAALGVGVCEDGMMSLCLGTAGVVHAFSSRPVRHKGGKIQILGHCLPGTWQVEANSSSAASSLEWFKNEFCQVEVANARITETSVFEALNVEAARSPVGSKGLLYTAWMQGADCPRFDSSARGTFIGLTLAHHKRDMMRAVMEGVSFEIYSMMLGIEETIGQECSVVRATGGGTKSPLWNQIQADVYNKTIETVSGSEATALGAAMCAAVGMGEYKDLREAANTMVKVKDRIEPIPANTAIYAELFALYNQLYSSLQEDFFPSLAKFQSVHVK